MTAADRPIIAIVGPTASGKTGVAIEVAREIGGEVVSMDSRQVYRGMDIGTAKPTPDEREDVPHHGFDLVDPDVRFGAGKFARYARDVVADVRSRGRVPILTGGTGLFLRALTDPVFREPPIDPARREALRVLLERSPSDELLRWLRRLDPPMAARYRDWGGRQRLLRALELPLFTGTPLSWWQRHGEAEAEPLRVRTFVLDVEPAVLVDRIQRRARAMFEGGLVDEVRALVGRFGADAPGLKAHGYMEVVPYLRGEATLEEAIDAVITDTRRYARRQRTWFRNQLGENAVWLDASLPRTELARRIVAAVGDPA